MYEEKIVNKLFVPVFDIWDPKNTFQKPFSIFLEKGYSFKNDDILKSKDFYNKLMTIKSNLDRKHKPN